MALLNSRTYIAHCFTDAVYLVEIAIACVSGYRGIYTNIQAESIKHEYVTIDQVD